MKINRLTVLVLFASLPWVLHAAPTLTADPYPATAVQPTVASITVNGANPIACTLAVGTAGAVIPTCNLASITAPGLYTLVMVVTNTKNCAPLPGGAECWAVGSASSAPFSYRWSASAVAIPVLTVAP